MSTPDSGSDGDALLAAFYAFRDAMLANDIEALDALLASDYRSYNLMGHLEGRELALSAYAPGAVSMERFEVEDLHTEVIGEVGLITGVGVVAGSAEGFPWYHRLRFCDVYVRREGAWQVLLSQATPMEDSPGEGGAG